MSGVPRHGMWNTKEYQAWAYMKQRCSSLRPQYRPYYLDRGIAVCERWVTFENFLHDMGRAPSAAHTLDRIDNDKGYEPSNCRWATRDEQQQNTRRTKRCVVDGQEYRSMREAARLTGRPYSEIRRLCVARMHLQNASAPEGVSEG